MRYDPDKPYPPGHFYLSRWSGTPICNTKDPYTFFNLRLGIRDYSLPPHPNASERKALGYIPSDFFE